MKLTRKEREKLRKNQEIIEASIKVFSDKGFYGATMQDIAKAAEMGVGTLYQYFKNKDDLYYNAILYKFNEFHQFYIEKLKDEHNFIDSISSIIMAWIEYFANNKDFFEIVFSEWANVKKTVVKKLKKRLTNEFLEKNDEIIKLIEHAKQAGEIKYDINSEVLGSMIFGTIQHIIHKGTFNRSILNPGTVVNGIVDIISPGILKMK